MPFEPDPMSMIDYLSTVLRGVFPDNVWDDSVEATAERILKLWLEYSGAEGENFYLTVFPAGDLNRQMVLVKDIEFTSLCPHHLLPYYGMGHIAYIPHMKVIGLSKIPRILDHFARRPCMQERLTEDVGKYLYDILEAKGVAVLLEARHTCMSCRGVRKYTANMVTSLARGVFLTDPTPRHEFLQMVGRAQL